MLKIGMALRYLLLIFLIFMQASCALLSDCADCGVNMRPQITARADLHDIEKSIDSYKDSCGRFPSESEGLKVLLAESYCLADF